LRCERGEARAVVDFQPRHDFTQAPNIVAGPQGAMTVVDGRTFRAAMTIANSRLVQDADMPVAVAAY
jgi:hypothetical protein